MTSPYAALAAAKYLAVEQARSRLARQETELHQMVAKLSPEAFTEYADITARTAFACLSLPRTCMLAPDRG